MFPMTRQMAEKRYGSLNVADGKVTWPSERLWMTMYDVPNDVAAVWINTATGQPTRRLYMNKDMVKPLTGVLDELREKKLLHWLRTMDGCFNLRLVRGMKTPSTHGYGIALDIAAKTNGLGVVGDLPPEFVSVWTKHGFVWGGAFRSRKDPMHFSLGNW